MINPLIYKIGVAVILLIVFIAIIADNVVQRQKIKTLQSKLTAKNVELALSKQVIETANITLERQNNEVKSMQKGLSHLKLDAILNVTNIEKEYQKRYDKLKKSLSDNSTCEDKLKTIDDSQRLFLKEGHL